MHLSSGNIEAMKLKKNPFLVTHGRVRLGIPGKDKKQCGFTLIELIMVMTIVGILAVFVAPRFFDANVFKSHGFADQVQATLRYAQKEAIAQHRIVCVAFSANSVTLMIDSDTPADGICNPAPAGSLQSPTGGAYVITAATGITFAAPVPTGFSFNALGQPTLNAKQIISIGGATNPITVEAETGYVHSP